MSKYDFFKWNLEWPSDVQIMYTKLSQGQFICVLSISKLRMTISHEELAKIDIYGQNTSNADRCPVSNRPTWLLATYIYMRSEAKLIPRITNSAILEYFGDYMMIYSDLGGSRWVLGAIKIARES